MRSPLSLYIHIPFCNSKCNYCAFVSSVGSDESKSEYVDALIKEIKLRAKTYGAMFEVTTVYIGGGTPSCLPDGAIKEIMGTIYTNFVVRNDAEITIEINPNTLTKEKAEEYLACNISRFSIGLQMAQSRLLAILGRTHKYLDFKNAVLTLQNAGATNISADIMLGLPTQTKEDIIETIKLIDGLGVKHISSYLLSVEEGTRFYQMLKNHELQLPSEKECIEMYNTAYKELKKRGYNRYEFSNFAKVGFKSKHNTIYWQRKEYLGLGVSAHSFIDNYRMANTSDVTEYLKHISKNEIPLECKDLLNETDAKEETIMLSLRLTEGIDLVDYQKQFSTNLLEEKKEAIDILIKNKFLLVEDNHLKATNEGFMVLDKIISMLAI